MKAPVLNIAIKSINIVVNIWYLRPLNVTMEQCETDIYLSIYQYMNENKKYTKCIQLSRKKLMAYRCFVFCHVCIVAKL